MVTFERKKILKMITIFSTWIIFLKARVKSILCKFFLRMQWSSWRSVMTISLNNSIVNSKEVPVHVPPPTSRTSPKSARSGISIQIRLRLVVILPRDLLKGSAYSGLDWDHAAEHRKNMTWSNWWHNRFLATEKQLYVYCCQRHLSSAEGSWRFER